MKSPGRPTGWRGVMNQRPQPSDFGLSPLADNVDSITQRQRVRVSRISHGIGGGMRIHEDADVFRAGAPRFSMEYMGRKLSLTGGRAAFGLYACCLVAALLLAHVHLRFRVHDMQMQQHALQLLQRNLQRQGNLLDQQLVNLVDPDRLRDFAQFNLQMEENHQVAEIQVDAELSEKYSPESIQQEHARMERDVAEAKENTLSRRFGNLAKMAWAFADNAGR